MIPTEGVMGKPMALFHWLRGDGMANSVKFSIPEREIDNIGVTFVRKKDGSKHGTITVRQNHLEWTPSDHTYPFRITWEQFAEFSVAHGERKGK
jgi:hypothetical protein